MGKLREMTEYLIEQAPNYSDPKYLMTQMLVCIAVAVSDIGDHMAEDSAFKQVAVDAINEHIHQEGSRISYSDICGPDDLKMQIDSMVNAIFERARDAGFNDAVHKIHRAYGGMSES